MREKIFFLLYRKNSEPSGSVEKSNFDTAFLFAQMMHIGQDNLKGKEPPSLLSKQEGVPLEQILGMREVSMEVESERRMKLVKTGDEQRRLADSVRLFFV